jgi:hypothetical protein
VLALVTVGGWCRASSQTITSINPSTVAAGSPSFSLTVFGSGFTVNSVVRVNAINRPTTFVSSLQLTATVLATDVAKPGTEQITVSNGLRISNPVNLTVVNVAGPALTRVAPGFVAQGAERVALTLIGANFLPGATVVISGVNGPSTDIAILNVSVLSSTVMTALINVGPTALVGVRGVDVVNPDGQTTAAPATTQPLRVQSSNSLGAPLSILTVAVTHPRDGTVVMQGQELSAEAILAGTGTGTVIGQWLWDGNVVEQFTASVIGGQSLAVETRQSLPTWSLGIHTLQLRMVQPNQVATRTITLVINPGDWRLEEMLGPAYGAVFSPDHLPLLRWKVVPGAAKYQVGFSARPYFSSIEKWYDAADNRWQVPQDVWRQQPDGELFWTVRTVEASGLARKPLPMRSIFRAGEGSLTSARPEPARTAAGNTLLEWKPVTQRALYLITLSSDREGTKIIRRYLASQPQIDLRAVDDRLDAGKTYFWRVDALSSSGKVILSGPPQSFVAAPKRKAALRDQRGQVVQLASLGMPAELPPRHAETARAGDPGLGMSAPDLQAQIAKRTPQPDSSVTESQPSISVEFQSKVNPLDVSLMLDDLDVTSMAHMSETQITYTPALPLQSGSHGVNLIVGTEGVSWKFSVSVPAAAPTVVTQAQGSETKGTDAETPPAPAKEAGPTPNVTAVAPSETPATQRPSLVEDGQFSSNTQYGSGGRPSPSNVIALGQHLSFQDGPWRADVNGSGLINSVFAPDSLRTAQNRTNNYVSQLNYQGQGWDAGLRAGILTSALYSGAQFVTAATPRQAVEVVLNTKAGAFGYFTNTSDLALGGGSGITFHQRIMGASWLAPLPKKWAEFRFMWLNAQDVGSPTTVTFDTLGHPIITANPLTPPQKGNIYGALLLFHLTPFWTWTSEYAWGDNNLNTSDPTSTSVFGRAWRTGLAGQAGKTLVNVAYRDVSPGFVNPANPGLTVASKSALRGVDSNVTQTTPAGTFGAGYSFLMNNLHSSDAPELVLHNLTQSWTKSFGVKTSMVVSASESLTQTGTVPPALLGLPPEVAGLQDLRNISGNVSVMRQIGTTSVSVTGVRAWNRNNILPTADVITSAVSLGANWLSKGIFQLNSSLSFNWVAAEKFSIGESRNIALSVQPALLWAKRGLQVAPLISLSQGRTLLATGTLTNDTLTGQYGGRIAWTLPGALKFNTFSVQGSYNQNRNSIAGLDLRGTQLLGLWTVTWGQRKQSY